MRIVVLACKVAPILASLGWALSFGHARGEDHPPALTASPAPSAPSAPASSSPSARAFHPRQTPIVEACKRIRASVVNIHSERNASPSEAVTQGTRINGMGTGVIVDARGYIVTNHHVIEDVTTLRVRLADGSNHSAKVLARDPETDLALLKIDAGRPLTTIPLGTTRDLMVGETVIAMGNAYGYEHTVTVGVVSAMGRDVVLNRELTYKSLIQTDASINPGNSGGPLVNVLGELVGVNVAIRAGAQGIGFAIPVETMIRVCADMLGQKHRGFGLGAGFREEVDRPREDGDLVRRVVIEKLEPGSIAAKAGLRMGDQLMQVGDAGVQSTIDWEKGFLERSQGDKVNLLVKRDGKELKLGVTMELSSRDPVAKKSGASDQIWAGLGIMVHAVGADQVTRVDNRLRGGLIIRDVRPESPASRAGWQKGDILVGLHDWEMVSHDNLLYAIKNQNQHEIDSYRFFLVREQKVVRGNLPFNMVIPTSDSAP